MKSEIALIFLESLIERIERDSDSGKLKLDGVISEKEYEAIGVAIDALGGTFEAPQQEENVAPVLSVQDPKPVIDAIPLNLDSLSLDGPEHPDLLLCLDFGTAMSKAFATDGSDEALVELEIGQQAGQKDPIFALVSSIFITDSGRILFGQQAISESINAGDRKRFDSIKDILCKDVVRNLDESPLEAAYNPTHEPLTKGDMVTLFLGYFTDMATTLLHDKGHSRYVRRRFTLPVLPPERSTWAEDQLRTLLARAQVLADTLHGKWQDGIDVGTAKQILDVIKNLEEIPKFLIDDGVVEPVAAVGSRFRNLVCKEDLRRLLMVVDVGAGTIDYALFAEIRQKDKSLQLSKIPGSIKVLRQAGDMVDKLLRRYILKTADVRSTDSDFHMIDASLSLRIRQDKEELFQKERVEFVLSNDKTGEIILSEFLGEPGVREFEKAIHEKFSQCINDVHESYISGLGSGGLAVVFTGGGAGLPMIKSIANVSIPEKIVRMQSSELIPPWVKDEYPELESEFPQLAVAIGGASRSLPALAPQTFEKFGGLDADGWTIEGDPKL